MIYMTVIDVFALLTDLIECKYPRPPIADACALAVNAFSKALELEDPLLFDPHIDHDKEAENSCVSCSPASAFSWRWHSSFYICHSDGS